MKIKNMSKNIDQINKMCSGSKNPRVVQFISELKDKLMAKEKKGELIPLVYQLEPIRKIIVRGFSVFVEGSFEEILTDPKSLKEIGLSCETMGLLHGCVYASLHPIEGISGIFRVIFMSKEDFDNKVFVQFMQF